MIPGDTVAQFKHGAPVIAVSVSENGRLMLSANGTTPAQHANYSRSAIPSTLRVWDLEAATEVLNTRYPGDAVSAAISYDGRFIAAVDARGSLQAWTIGQTGAARPSFTVPAQSASVPISSGQIFFASNGPRVGFALARGGAIYDIESGRLIHALASTQRAVGFTRDLEHLLVTQESDDRMRRAVTLQQAGSSGVLRRLDQIYNFGPTYATLVNACWAATGSGGHPGLRRDSGFVLWGSGTPKAGCAGRQRAQPRPYRVDFQPRRYAPCHREL